jgi:putative ABC transport system permease protein
MIILIVGGIVVMNIMLVSVTERTFEVGLRKALGATKKQILLQFLIESALLCVIGGIIGLLLAAGVTQLITILAGMTMTITITYVILSVGCLEFIGIVAGLYPAWKAARLDPIVALDTELTYAITTSLPFEVLKMSTDSIRSHKFRSFLTILGIVVGVIRRSSSPRS